VGKLSHPNLVQATDAGEANDTPFLVMEYLDGVNVARVLDEAGPLPIAEACELARQAALGLAEIHAQGLVHRDVKPSNHKQTSAGVVKVLDLGLALLRESPAAEATSSQTVLGSFDYMAPEQSDHPHGVTRAADLYGLGCTLYHLLTGGPPFPAPPYESPLQKLKAHATASPPDVRALRPDIPAALASLVGRLLAKDPRQRPHSAAEVAAALAPFAQSADLLHLLDPGAGPAVATQPPRRARRWPLLAAIAALAGLVILGLVVLVIQTDSGTLEIRSDDKEVKVIVERGGELIKIIDLKTDRKITLRSGKYQFKLGDAPNDLELSTSELTLRRGDREILTIRRVPRDKTPVAVVKSAPQPDGARVLKGHTGWVYALAFSPDGRWLASGSNDRTIRVWNARTGELQHALPQSDPVFCLAFAPDNKTLAAASHRGDGKVTLWNAENGKKVDALALHAGCVWDVAFSPKGALLATAGQDKTIAVWDLKKGALLHRLKDTERVRRVCFIDEGKTLVSAGSDLRLWDVASGTPKSSMPHVQTSSIKVSPDGRILAAAHWGNGTISLFDIATGKFVHSWRAHDAVLNDLTFSPSGKVLASAGHDGMVRLWDAASYQLLTVLRGHVGPVDPVLFAPDGQTLASGGVEDFTVRLWNVGK
jgi:WD40 repeat protein